MLNFGKKKNDIPWWPLELPANQHSRFGSPELDWAKLAVLVGWLCNSKDHRRMSNFFLSPLLVMWVDQNIKKIETSSSRGIWNWYNTVWCTLHAIKFHNHHHTNAHIILRWNKIGLLWQTSHLYLLLGLDGHMNPYIQIHLAWKPQKSRLECKFCFANNCSKYFFPFPLH